MCRPDWKKGLAQRGLFLCAREASAPVNPRFRIASLSLDLRLSSACDGMTIF